MSGLERRRDDDVAQPQNWTVKETLFVNLILMFLQAINT